MKSFNPALSLLALDCQSSCHLSNDEFPKTEEGFKKYFFLHPTLMHPVLRNQVTVGCILCSSITIKEFKTKMTNTTSLIKWLTKHQIYIEADSLGYEVTCITSYLLKVHPNITHHDFLKELLTKHLCHATIKLEDVIALNNSATEHYQHIMDSGNDSEAYVPPFKIFPTSISSRPNKYCISTCTLGIKTTLKYQTSSMNY